MDFSKLDKTALDRPRMPLPDPAIIPLIKAYDAMRGDAEPALLEEVISAARDETGGEISLEHAAQLFSSFVDFRVEFDSQSGQYRIQRIMLGKTS